MVGWWFGTWLLFSHILGNTIPIDELIFFRWVGIPPSSKWLVTSTVVFCNLHAETQFEDAWTLDWWELDSRNPPDLGINGSMTGKVIELGVPSSQDQHHHNGGVLVALAFRQCTSAKAQGFSIMFAFFEGEDPLGSSQSRNGTFKVRWFTCCSMMMFHGCMFTRG